MADLKISQMTPVTLAELNPAGKIPIVQGGANKAVTPAVLLEMVKDEVEPADIGAATAAQGAKADAALPAAAARAITVAQLPLTATDGDVIQLSGFHTAGDGGGDLYWDATRAKNTHNGGTVIDPGKVGQLASWPGTYFTAASSGSGCWVRRIDGTVTLGMFGVSPSVDDNRVSVNAAIASGAKTLDYSGTFKTSGGHVLDNVHIRGNLLHESTIEHVDGEILPGTYAQAGTTTLTVDCTAHGCVVRQSVYLTFSSGDGVSGLYVVAAVVNSNQFTVLASSATTFGNVSVDPGFVCIKDMPAIAATSYVGTGISDSTILCLRTGGTGVGRMVQNYGHSRTLNVVSVDYDAAEGYGFLWENYNGRWSESGIHQRLRAVNCMNAYVHRQNIGAAGTQSFAYSRYQGTVSSPPTGGKGFVIGINCSPYSCDIDFNIYMDSDATAQAVVIDGSLKHGRARFCGEKPGNGAHTAFKVGATGTIREQELLAVFENGLIDIDASATIVNSQGMIVSTSEDVWLTLDSKPAATGRINGNFTLPSATWSTITSWTEDMERPSGANSFASGVFTAPIKGLYRVTASACFTPAIGDRCAVRIATTARNLLIAQSIAQSTLDLVIGGSHLVLLDAGDTAAMQLYTTNESGDTIRASDGDGSKTLFSIAYEAS